MVYSYQMEVTMNKYKINLGYKNPWSKKPKVRYFQTEMEARSYAEKYRYYTGTFVCIEKIK